MYSNATTIFSFTNLFQHPLEFVVSFASENLWSSLELELEYFIHTSANCQMQLAKRLNDHFTDN